MGRDVCLGFVRKLKSNTVGREGAPYAAQSSMHRTKHGRDSAVRGQKGRVLEEGGQPLTAMSSKLWQFLPVP